MSSPADPLEASVRAKVKATIAKSLTPELTELIEAKLAQSFSTGTSYKSAFRTLTSLLKPKSSESLKADPSVSAPVAGKKSATQEADFENVIEDLLSKKLSVGKVINRVMELEKSKKQTLNQIEVSKNAAAPLAQQQLEDEWNKAQRARVLGLTTQRIKAAKDKLATGGLEEPSHWVEIADASMELYYSHAPNTAYLNQALKSYNKAEALSSEYLAKHPSFFLRRAAIYTTMEDFDLAVEDLRRMAKLKQVEMPPTAIAAAAAAPSADGTYSSLVAPRLAILHAYVSTVAKFVAGHCGWKESAWRQSLRELPNPSKEQMSREMTNLVLLKEGVNQGKGIVLRVLGKVDQTSVYSLANNTNVDAAATPLPLASVHESLESRFRTPKSYGVMDADGKPAVLTIYNVMGDEKKQRSIKAHDMLVVMDPFIKDVKLEASSSSSSASSGEKQYSGGEFRSIQIHNPMSLFVNLQVYAEEDVVPTE